MLSPAPGRVPPSAGVIPPPSSKVLFVQDVIIDLEGLIHVINSLQIDYDIMPVAADALFSFVSCDEDVLLDQESHSRLYVQAWNDSLSRRPQRTTRKPNYEFTPPLSPKDGELPRPPARVGL